MKVQVLAPQICKKKKHTGKQKSKVLKTSALNAFLKNRWAH